MRLVDERDAARKLVAVLLREVSIHREPITDTNHHDRWRRLKIAMAETGGPRLKYENVHGKAGDAAGAGPDPDPKTDPQAG